MISRHTKNTLAMAVAAGLLSVYQTASAQVVIGNWESPLVGSGQVAPANIQPSGPTGTMNAVGGDGWVDWQNSGVFSLSTIGATNGSHSLKVQTPNLGPFGAFVQDLAISLNSTGHVADFLTSGKVAMDVTWDSADWSTAESGFWGSAVGQLALNASNNGVSPINGFYTAGDANGHANTDSGRPAGDQFNGFRDPSWFAPTAQNPNPGPTITATLTWDMSQFVDGDPTNGEVTAVGGTNNAGFINFVFATLFDSADVDPTQIAWYIDNVRLLPRVVTSTWQGGAPDPNGGSGTAALNNWYASLNWTQGVPGVKDSVANLGTLAGTGAQTVHSDSPVTLAGLTFDNTGGWTVTGAGTFTMSATSNVASISVASGNHSVANPFQLASDTTITVTPSNSTLTLSNLLSTPQAITMAGAGSLIVNTIKAASLNITGGTVSIAPNGTAAGASNVTGLIVAPNTTLDLNNNDLIVGSGGAGPIATLVKGAFHNGAWDQPGITSSSARNSGHKTALAVVSAADYISITGSSTLDGMSVTAGSTVVKYTYEGDANLDGSVNVLDFNQLAANYGTASTASWVQGDFNYDGIVNALDLNAIATDFGKTLPLPAAPLALGSLVPEPASAMMLFGVGAMVLRLRRRRSS